MKTKVGIIGAGPAGLLLSEILFHHGIDSIVLEKRSRSHILSRIRAGVLEQNSVDLLKHYGLGSRIAHEGKNHDGIKIVWGKNKNIFLNVSQYTNKKLTVYGQTQVQADLFNSADHRHATILTEVQNVKIENLHSSHPFIRFQYKDTEEILECDFIAGCDGYHGVSRSSIPNDAKHIYEKIYPFSWIGMLSISKPISHITYANHARGFALASARNPMLSRYYLQVPSKTNIADWSDEKFWSELKLRFTQDITDEMMTGPSIEKSIAHFKSSVVEPMQYGKLFLVGDAAHILPPTGAKGLNLAFSDVFYLSRALNQFYRGNTKLLDTYSDVALRRVWHSMRAASYLTHLLHRFPKASKFDQKNQEYELQHLQSSQCAQAALAEQYAGMDYELGE